MGLGKYGIRFQGVIGRLIVKNDMIKAIDGKIPKRSDMGVDYVLWRISSLFNRTDQ